MDAIKFMKRAEVTVNTVLHRFAVHMRQGQGASVNRSQAEVSYRRSSQ